MSGLEQAFRVEFREIDLDRDRDLCIAFRADSFVCSFGTDERFFRDAGPGCREYLERLRRQNHDLPGSCVHVWQNHRIVGQVELRRDPSSSERGHVVLFYLIPVVRGSGIAEDLHRYAIRLLGQAGITTAWLRVGPSNTRAVRYYVKHGWHDRGQDPEHPETNRMERGVKDSEGRCDDGA